MRRQPPTSDQVVLFAAAAYDYLAEIENPSPDATMKRLTLDRLREAHGNLPYDDRRILSRIAGRT